MFAILKPIVMKSVHELREDELEELRQTLFDEVSNHGYPTVNAMPNEYLFKFFKGTTFVEDDFFCNQLI
tara:strand:+ start:3887 stop:4093 length:207 start_codon:yes stop_codon:yes gene_type:complete